MSLSPPNLRAVNKLLLEMFNQATLEQFIVHTIGRDFAAGINFASPMSSVVFDTINALDRHGWITVANFWQAMIDEYPLHAARIGEVAAPIVPKFTAKETVKADAGGDPCATVIPADPADTLRVSLFGADVDPSRPLRLDLEFREIKRRLDEGRHHDKIRAEVTLAPTWADLRSTLLHQKPHVLHFGGHGEHDGGLLFADEGGQSVYVPPDDLVKLLRILRKNVGLVVLNACYSKALAERLGALGLAVIGMDGAISDAAAITFSRSLYEVLASRETIRDAFELSVLELGRLKGGEEHTPVLGPPFT